MKVTIGAKHIKGTVDLKLGKYMLDNSIAIHCFSLDGEPLFTATVCIQDEKPPDGFVFLKGWSESEGIPEALEKAGIVRLTGRTIPTGYCEVQEARLLI